jgi:glycosyltransferase involved in cell wall biosynthesis
MTLKNGMSGDSLTVLSQEKMSVLKVCLISPLGYGLYNPKSGLSFGGAEVQFYLLANELAGDPAYSVSVLTTVSENPGVEACGQLKIFKRQGQRRTDPKLKRGLLNRIQHLRSYFEAFKEMRRQFIEIDADVYFHAGAGVEVGAYALICRLLRRRFLFFIASSADLWEPYGKVEGPLKWLFPLGVKAAHEVVCRSSEQLDRLHNQYGRKGVLIRTGHPHPPARRVPKSYVLWVGRGNPLKRPEMFLDLAARMPHRRFVMVVAHEDAHLDLLQQVRARASMLDNLDLYEDVPWSKIDNYFARARVFVNTSTYEGFPNTFVQAALHGAPVVSLRVDPDQLLSTGQLGLCAGESFDRLVDLVQGLCESELGWNTLSEGVERYASTHHLLSVSVDALKILLGSSIYQPIPKLNQELSA